jgi:hypothetical protein
MSEDNPSKQDKAFTSFLLIVLKAIEVVGYVGIVVLLIVAGWTIRQSGWQALYPLAWPLLGAGVILAGSIWGAKLLRQLVL